MANRLYPSYRASALGADVDWLSDDIRVVLADNTYVYSDAHDFLDDVGGGARIAVSGSLASKTATAGVAGAADITVAAVPAAHTIVALIIYKHTGTDSTSNLIAYIDTAQDGSPLSLATDGTDVTVRWSTDPTKIFKL